MNLKSALPALRLLWAWLTAQVACLAIDFGPLYDSFPLTLQEGKRTEWIGPLVSVRRAGGIQPPPALVNVLVDLLVETVTGDQRSLSGFRFAGQQKAARRRRSAWT